MNVTINGKPSKATSAKAARNPMPRPTKAPHSNRARAAMVLHAVLQHGQALDDAILNHTDAQQAGRDRAHVMSLCFAALRELRAFEWILKKRIAKKPDALLQALLLVALADLYVLRAPAHATVAESVNATRELALPYASGLVNAVLRKLVSELDALVEEAKAQSAEARFAMPEWLITRLRQAYDAPSLDQIVQGCRRQAPMWLRVNRRQFSAAQYRSLLGGEHSQHDHLADAVCLTQATGVQNLPAFADGACSVQDAAAQCAAWFLAPKAGERILDACAAPGGKSAHLLELAPEAQLLAVDIDAARVQRIEENFARLGLSADVQIADAADVHGSFDAILLDAPCSATGVIRRHPDIAVLRRPTDLKALLATQQRLLHALWQKLKIGGRLLYATCSILPEENVAQLLQFCAAHSDARELPLPSWFGVAQAIGRQNFPGMQDMDGFYYALLQKVGAQ